MTAEMHWRRASHCENGATCVEVRRASGGGVNVRQSTVPDRVMWFSDTEWTAFIAGVRAGEFDINRIEGESV